ncbi:2,3-bisphosphoglycerate-independent phosphoglycerate mutase [Thermofilum pendens]|uniref:2,3-bisphosphoglycerate-independent phosphoglycerate mutase n=1 Tax=Thermofilum pendens (strain DSM 2475 / Hrk 5) TaxID=368408 RepID=A1S0I2_THEPD|nr:2,3-bisphosphoglycerate-independent phosphoglycerate mutase [Thermofilum pendens]ABL78962.1 phosphoglycerate mutase [Thermofilum pendens Hrk 5]
MSEYWSPKPLYRSVVLILDGLGDRPVPELGGRTPLQVARKPTLDSLAAEGVTGIMDVIEPGVRPGTDTGHMALFGYDPYRFYPGRGPLEAAGIGVELKPGDVALRANFATVREEGGRLIVVDRRAGRIRGEDAEALTRYLNERIGSVDDVRVSFHHATAHRLVVVLRGDSLSPRVSDSDPGTAREGEPVREVKPLTNDPESERTARILWKLLLRAHEELERCPVNEERVKRGLLPANAVLTRGAGMVPYGIVPFREQFGATAYLVAEEATVLGVARILGIEGEIPGGSTADLDTDLDAIFNRALDAYRRGYEFVFIHVKGTDIAGHDAKPLEKARFIERVDEAFAGFLSRIDRGKTIVAVTADHSTPCTVRDHSGDPVPLLINGPGVRRDDVTSFDEISCARGGLGRIRGVNLVRILLDLMNKPIMFGE